jgi:hypothetical protein
LGGEEDGGEVNGTDGSLDGFSGLSLGDVANSAKERKYDYEEAEDPHEDAEDLA